MGPDSSYQRPSTFSYQHQPQLKQESQSGYFAGFGRKVFLGKMCISLLPFGILMSELSREMQCGFKEITFWGRAVNKLRGKWMRKNAFLQRVIHQAGFFGVTRIILGRERAFSLEISNNSFPTIMGNALTSGYSCSKGGILPQLSKLSILFRS